MEGLFEEENSRTHCQMQGMIDHLNKNQAIIKTSDNQELAWPVNQLPDGSQEGKPIWLKISLSETDTELAKKLLNQLLQKEKQE